MMNVPFSRLALGSATCLLALVAAASPALASGDQVVHDCVTRTLKSHYSAADYDDALTNMPSDVDEYSTCRAQIAAARDRDLAGSSASAAKGQTARKMAVLLGAAAAESKPGGPSGDRSAGLAVGGTTPAPAPAGDPAAATTPASDGTIVSDLAATEPNTVDASWPLGAAATANSSALDGVPLLPVLLALAVVLGSAGRLLFTLGRRQGAGSPKDGSA